MDLYKEILQNLLREEILEKAVFENLEKIETPAFFESLMNFDVLTHLKKIKVALSDDSLDDAACFMKIEKIVCVFEELGSDGGGRHDF